MVSAQGLRSCSFQATEHRVSSCAQGPSCSTVCGIFPDQGLNPMFPTLAGRFFTTESPVKPCFKILNKSLCKVMLQPFASFSENLKRQKNNSIQGDFFHSSDPLIDLFLWLVLQEPSHLSSWILREGCSILAVS